MPRGLGGIVTWLTASVRASGQGFEPQPHRRHVAWREVGTGPAAVAQCRLHGGFGQGGRALQVGGARALRQMGPQQALPFGHEARAALQGQRGGVAVAGHPVGAGHMHGGERGQPEVEVAVQGGVVEHRDHRRQGERFAVQARDGGAHAAAGDALQPAARATDARLSGRHHADARCAAGGAKQEAHRAFHCGQGNGVCRKRSIGRTGDEAVPAFADPLFHGVNPLCVGAGFYAPRPGPPSIRGWVRGAGPRASFRIR